MSLEEAVSESNLDNKSILDSSNKTSTGLVAIPATIDEALLEAFEISECSLYWYSKYLMPQVNAAIEVDSYTDRIPGISEYVEHRCNELKQRRVHACDPICNPTYCELKARTLFRYF
jgi:hypothetical protein